MDSEFDIHEYRRRRLRDAETELELVREQNETLLRILAAILAMVQESGHDWKLVLDAACELEGVNPGRMTREL